MFKSCHKCIFYSQEICPIWRVSAGSNKEKKNLHGSLNCKGASRPNILEKYCLRQIIQNCAYIDYWSIFDHLEMHVVPSFMQLRYCIALSRASSHFYQNIVYFLVLYHISNRHIHTGYTYLNIFFDGIFSNSTSIFRQKF